MIQVFHKKDDYRMLNISTRLLIDCALRKEYEVTYCSASVQTGTGIVICRKGTIEVRFQSDATSLSPVYAYFAANDKVLTGNLLRGAGVATPVGYECSRYEEVASHLDFTSKRYVVKPTNMDHGDGVRTDLKSEKDIRAAIDYARQVSTAKTVLVQEQAVGDEYRFLVLNGEVIAVAGRQPASVLGDGIHQIRELIVHKNEHENRGEGHVSARTKISIEDVRIQFSEDFLAHVPLLDERVFVAQTSNLSKGGDAIDYTDQAHQSLCQMAVQAAQACSLGLAGVDILTDDIESPSKAVVIEVNLAPDLRMHHFPTAGIPRNVAGMIFDAIEERGRQQMIVSPVSAYVDFRVYKNLKHIPARIDTGARTSSLWASDIKVKNGIATFKLFGRGSQWYTGKVVKRKVLGTREVKSSTGHVQQRYVVNMSIQMLGRRLNAKFTLSDRSTQMYPILIGRNTLRGNFLVDSSNPGEAMLYKYPEEAAKFNVNKREAV